MTTFSTSSARHAPAPAGPHDLADGGTHWSVLFADRIARHPVGDYPESTLRQGRLVLSDTLAAMAAGAKQPDVALLTARLADPAGTATLVAGGGARANPDAAAFRNAVAGTSAEMDEGNYEAGGHPAVQSVPAALAAAEALGASGADLLDAIIMGYEAGARIGRASRLRDSVHSHGTWGAVCAAVAVARLRKFDAGAMQAAIAMAASLATATSRSSGPAGATIRNVYAGVASRNGLLACDLAECGFAGQADAADIAFGQVLGTGFQPARALEGWAETWLIDRNFFKFWACCKDTQGALEAVCALKKTAGAGGVDPASIKSIHIATFADAAALAERTPPTTLAARFSVPFVVATMLVRGDAGAEAFTTDTLSDPEILSLAARVTLSEEPRFTALMPAALTRMQIAFRDGTSATVEVEGSLGDHERPFDPALHGRKFAALGGDVWADHPAIREQCLAIDRIADIRPWLRSTG